MRRPVPPKPKKVVPQKMPDKAYAKVWRLVDGAVRDAFANHPDYLARPERERVVRNSINKRVVGALWSFAKEARGRAGA